jgi:poly(A) polymerase
LASLQALRSFGLHRGVFAVLDAALPEQETASASSTRQQEFIRRALEDTDERVASGRAVAPSFLLACLLWFEVQQRWSMLKSAGEPAFPALQQAIDDVFAQRVGDISGRGKLAADMREIWMMQPRFERRTPSAAAALVDQPRFRAGYDFLRLRCEVDEVDVQLADWWEEFSLASDEDRQVLLQEVRSTQTSTSSRKRSAAPHEDASSETQTGAPARKRRRRRRRAGSGEAGSESEPAATDGGSSPR